MSNTPKTLLAAISYFADERVCREYMSKIKWPDRKRKCPTCGCDRVNDIPSRPGMMRCGKKACRKQFSYKVGTIFEDSAIPLSKWFVAAWFIANCKNGISSHELARHLGVSQKSCWHMLHRIRCAMRTGTFVKISGEVETAIGGLAKNMHKDVRKRRITGTGMKNKAIVHGLLERGEGNRPSRVKMQVVPNQQATTLQPIVREHVRKGARVYSDALASYRGLDADYVHEVVDHAVEYVRGRVHTNGLENYWSLFKRCVHGTWVAVSPAHLVRYVVEQERRFNDRKKDDAGRFDAVMRNVVDRRLTWKELTGSV